MGARSGLSVSFFVDLAGHDSLPKGTRIRRRSFICLKICSFTSTGC